MKRYEDIDMKIISNLSNQRYSLLVNIWNMLVLLHVWITIGAYNRNESRGAAL